MVDGTSEAHTPLVRAHIQTLPRLCRTGAYLAARAFQEDRSTFGWGFSLFALAEIVYMTYHVNLTVFLLAHTIAEVLDAVAFVVLFTAAVRAGVFSVSEERRVSVSH